MKQSAEEKSLCGNLWRIPTVDDRLAELLVQKCNIPLVMARILALRGIAPTEVASYLDQKIQDLMPALATKQTLC